MLINENLYADNISAMEYYIEELYKEDDTYSSDDIYFFDIDNYGVIGIEAGEDWNLVFPELTIKQLTQLKNGESVGPISPIEL